MPQVLPRSLRFPSSSSSFHSSPLASAHRTSFLLLLYLSECTSSSPALRTDYFDTHATVTRLTAASNGGLTREQAEGLVDTLEQIMKESMGNLQEGLVSRAEHYKVRFFSFSTDDKPQREERTFPLVMITYRRPRRCLTDSSFFLFTENSITIGKKCVFFSASGHSLPNPRIKRER
jgi:hypothetical protein